MGIMLKILCDVCGDLTIEYCRENNITIMPMVFTLGGQEQAYTLEGFSAKNFYDAMRNGASSGTSQLNIQNFIEFFDPILAEGNDMIFVCLSSGLSGSYANSVAAVEQLKEKYPERKIATIDSLGASMGEGLLTAALAHRRDEGMEFDEIVAWAEKNKHHVIHWFTVDDLKYLYRGGRVSRTGAIVGSLLNIKPVLQCNAEGKLVPVEKVKGRKRALRALAESLDQYGENIDGQEIFISHGDCEEDALLVKDMIAEKYKNCKFVMGNIGAVIGAHSGPGTVAVFFFGKKRFI